MKLFNKASYFCFKLSGFSLVEVLVTVSILAMIGVIIATIVTRSFQGNSKSELIGNVKQNGQTAMAAIENDIRNSDTVVCPASGKSLIMTLLAKDSGQYTRFIISPENGNQNGSIVKENLGQNSPVAPDDYCNLTTTPTVTANTVSLIDSISKSAVSLKNIPATGFTVIKSAGYKDTVLIEFNLGSAVNSGLAFQNSIGGVNNALNFKTTVQLR